MDKLPHLFGHGLSTKQRDREALSVVERDAHRGQPRVTDLDRDCPRGPAEHIERCCLIHRENEPCPRSFERFSGERTQRRHDQSVRIHHERRR